MLALSFVVWFELACCRSDHDVDLAPRPLSMSHWRLSQLNYRGQVHFLTAHEAVYHQPHHGQGAGRVTTLMRSRTGHR